MVKQVMTFTKEEFKNYMMNIVPNLSNVEIDKHGNISLTYEVSAEKLQQVTNNKNHYITP